MIDFNALFAGFSSMKVAVIGDVMLDTYWWGNVERISPEAPVPVVAMQHREQRIGGAGNVALNTVSLNAKTTLFSITGNDVEAHALISLLSEKNINTEYCIKSNERVTTNKIRIMARNQQMMRLDAEVISDISMNDESELLQNFQHFLQNDKPDVVILEDYNKGVLTEKIIESVISLCKENNIITAVDPKRKNFFSYQHADIFKPNLKEVQEALNITVDNVSASSLKEVHQRLKKKLQHTVSLITLSEKGIFIEDDNAHYTVPAYIRNIADVSGAGDTVIAVASLVYAATKNILITAEVANLAGGIVCEDAGTVPISREKLLNDCFEMLVKQNGNRFPSIH